VGIGAIVPTAKLDVRGNFNVGIVDKDVKTGFFQVTPQKDAPVNLTSNKGYHFDKDITIESGVLRGNDQLALNTKGANRITILDSNGNVGIGFPDPQANLDIKGTAQVRTSKDPSTDPSTGFFKIEPQDNQPVQFTTNKGYHFDKDITIESGVVNGNNQLALNTKGTNRITILDSNGNVGIGFSDPQVNLDVKETLQIRTTKPSTDPTAGFFKVETKDDQPVQFTTNKGYHFNKDIAIESGNLAISTGFIQLGTDSKIQSIDKGIQISTSASNVQIALDNSLGETQVKFTSTNNTKYTFDGGIQVGTDASHVRVALDGSQVKFMTKDHTEYSFDQSINVNGITINSGVIHSPIQQLFLSGKTFIGDKGSSSPRVPDNGLLVAGNVGVGLPSPSNLGAKLEIESTQPTDNLNSFALNVQTGNSRLFSIRNNGDIFVSRRLLINTRADAITSPPLDKDIDVKLYVEGKVFGRDVTTGNIQVLSSRTLKQNIVELSSQEVDEVLRSLNPVKFTYKTDKDQTLHLGFIAEDVPEVVASSNRQTISPVDIVAALTKVVKDHRQAIVSLSKMVKEQQKAIATLTQKINELENNHR
jgi:hypothetical protein